MWEQMALVAVSDLLSAYGSGSPSKSGGGGGAEAAGADAKDKLGTALQVPTTDRHPPMLVRTNSM